MTVWAWVLVVLAVWVVLSIPSAIGLGRAIHLADEREQHGQDQDT